MNGTVTLAGSKDSIINPIVYMEDATSRRPARVKESDHATVTRPARTDFAADPVRELLTLGSNSQRRIELSQGREDR
jgi:hypothetical protein